MRLPTWKPTRGLGHGDMWLLLNEISEDSTDRTWIGVSVGSGGRTQLGLELTFRNALKQIAAAVVQEKVHADRLQKAGFRKDESGTRLFMPIAIDRLRLAKGYGENCLAEALGPVTKAVEAVIAANHDLDALVEAVRNKARGK